MIQVLPELLFTRCTCRRLRPDLLDAIREFPVEERGEINRSKLGWLLKKHANRIVKGLEFQLTRLPDD